MSDNNHSSLSLEQQLREMMIVNLDNIAISLFTNSFPKRCLNILEGAVLIAEKCSIVCMYVHFFIVFVLLLEVHVPSCVLSCAIRDIAMLST